MSKQLKHTTLGELLNVRRGMSLPGENYATSGEYKRLTLANFDYNNHCFKEDKSKDNLYYTGKIRPDCLLKKGAIITPLTEQVSGLLGETARIPKDDIYIQSGDIGLVEPYPNKLEDTFAEYLVSSSVVKKQLDSCAQQTKIRHTSPNEIMACEVWIPEDLDVQYKIGKLLSNIDAKIALNKSICSDLEALAKEIYEYWFVQFDFPDENGKPYKSSGGRMVWNKELSREIPEGWDVKSLGDIEPNIVTGKTPSTNDNSNYCGNIPFITIRDIRGNMFIVKTSQTLSHKGADTQKNKYIPQWSICVSCIASVGLVGFATENSQTNQQINSIICKNEYNRYFLYFAILDFFENSYGAKIGNTFANMNKKEFTNIRLLYSESVTKMYSNVIVKCFQNILCLSEEKKQLTELRDFLLPLLMNGQISID